MSKTQPIIILGAGGHASVLIELLKTLNKSIIGVVAPENYIKNYADIPYLGDDSIILNYATSEIMLVNGLGSISVDKNKIRGAIYVRYKALGYQFDTLIHPSSIIASTVTLQEGVQVMAGVVLQPNVVIGQNTIINTGTCIDHDCIIGENVHIAPGVTLSGNVHIGHNSFVGVGATIIQGIKTGESAMIRAGKTIVKISTVL